MYFMPIPSNPAYLDPVASGAILQILVGIFLVLSVIIRTFWRNIVSFFTGIQQKFSKKEEDSQGKE